MKNFIFLTYEDTTYCKKKSTGGWETVNDLKVIGIAQGNDSDDAFLNLIPENEWVFDFDFDEIFCYQLEEDYEKSKKNFSVNEYKKSHKLIFERQRKFISKGRV